MTKIGVMIRQAVTNSSLMAHQRTGNMIKTWVQLFRVHTITMLLALSQELRDKVGILLCHRLTSNRHYLQNRMEISK